jgi:O-antigen ligase
LTFVGLIIRLTARATQAPPSASRKRVIALASAIPVVAALGFAALFALSDRLPGLNRFFDDSIGQDMRFRALPTIWAMARDFGAAGAGMGSFERVYYAFETDANLQAPYLNMAHNDWLQLVIEGGAPLVLLALAAIATIAIAITRLGRVDRPGSVAAAGIAAILGIASVFDYPLRTPTLQVIAVVLAAMAWHAGKAARLQK